MKGMREIRNRIKAVKGTGQITHAMELVAASKMKKAQRAAENGRAYATLLLDLSETVSAHLQDYTHITHKFLKPDGKRLIIVISTDKGLCGSLNNTLFKFITEIKDDCVFIAVGNKAAKFLARTGRTMLANFKLSDSVKFSETRSIADFALKQPKEQKISSIEVLYPLYINTLRQDPVLVKLAPLDKLDAFVERIKKAYKLDLETQVREDRGFTFEPSAEEIMQELPSFYFKQSLHYMALDAKASEHSARMVAMKGASDNANRLVQNLTLEYNKARQEAITTEILELASGAQL